MKDGISYEVFVDGQTVETAAGSFCLGELFDIVTRLDSLEKAIDVLDWASECEIGDVYSYDDWTVLCWHDDLAEE